MSGHGISDAVRAHIRIWVDNEVVDALYNEHSSRKGSSAPAKFEFRSSVRDSSEWVRRARRKHPTGHEREYYCKRFPDDSVKLIVHSPPADMSADSYVFSINNKVIAGGRTKLKSVLVSKAVSASDKSTVTDVEFVKFSQAELERVQHELQFGDGFAFLERERE